MRRIRRTEVTVETDEILIIRSSQEIAIASCPECAEKVLMISPEQAAMVTCTNVRAIYRGLESGRVHYVETPGGSLLVCPDSILKLAIKSYRAD
ncbi:MAG: hypothetical protein DMF60_16660 [Acidobacteria bacterium]|nr:MAG: hypothetical protein DMF60_16660 [Acidobacteriota bacterium]